MTASPKVSTVPGVVSRICAVSSSRVLPQLAMFPATISVTVESPGGGGGAAAIVAEVVPGALDAPRLSVTTRLTEYVPAAAWRGAGGAPVPLAPSRNVRAWGSGVLPWGSDEALPSNCPPLPATPAYGPP